MGRLSNTKNRQKQHASNLREGQSGRFQNNAERAKSEHISMVDLTAAEEEEPLDENILTNDKESDAEEYKEMNQPKLLSGKAWRWISSPNFIANSTGSNAIGEMQR